MKVVVFLMRHNRKDKRYKYLAYTQTYVDIFVPILLLVIIGTGTARRNKIFRLGV